MVTLMGRIKSAISARGVKKLSKTPGMHAVGGVSGLYLCVNVSPSLSANTNPTFAASWIYRYSFSGRRRDMGLGSFSDFSLEEARHKASSCRSQVLQGIDPLEDKQKQVDANKKAHIKRVTFQQCINSYLDAHGDAWKNAKHRAQWRSTLETYACPSIGNLNVAHIDAGLVLKVLEPIWKTKTETATRLRGRIESILDWATVRGFREGENSARWKGHLDKLLPSPAKIAKVKHFTALPYKEISQFMQQLRNQSGIGAAALEFSILTAARSGEVRGALWSEINLSENLWLIPADRMKAGREHRIPLSDAAITVLNRMQENHVSDYVFPGVKQDKPLSDMSLTATLKRMGRSDLTAHGFRSTFRDWASETTAYPQEVCEMALAHTIANKVEAAYRRGDLFDKRIHLMHDWANYCNNLTADTQS
ncbi:MAG: tyrosine-type recombinase/integrase [Nitrosomonas sp.]|nr:tyrosine-type recombinase/integrase [Nitrosomonas sp.]